MESFRWDTCFVTGIPTVDEQHHRLVDIINAFGDLLLRPEGSTSEEMERVFTELADYAAYHFSEEELLMQEHAIDSRHFAHQKKEHAQFLVDVAFMRTGAASNQRGKASELLQYLCNWLAYHILGSDQLLARLVEATQLGMSQEAAFAAHRKEHDPATATLLQAMNRLFEQVSERNRELAELNQTLEARVVERTHALSDANLRLENMAMTDVLTGLPNRRHALLALEREWRRADDHGAPLACMLLDADGFKHINDTQGHDAGDEVLCRLAVQLSHAVRNDDLVCRLGGDEFLIVCIDTPLDGMLQLAEKVRREVAALYVPAGDGGWQGSISVGVAVRSANMRSLEDLLKAADMGVYQAKHLGRNCVATGG